VADVFCQDVSGELLYTFDFSDVVPAGIVVNSIAITSAPSLTNYLTDNDYTNNAATYGLRGIEHGKLYNVKAVATLDSGEKPVKTVTIRGWQGQ